MFNIHTTIAAVALTLVPAIASAEPSEPTTFRHNGQTYTYTSEQVGDMKVLRGHVGADKTPFELNVGKRSIAGSFNGSPVAFSLKSVRRIQGIVVMDQVAAR